MNPNAIFVGFLEWLLIKFQGGPLLDKSRIRLSKTCVMASFILSNVTERKQERQTLHAQVCLKKPPKRSVRWKCTFISLFFFFLISSALQMVCCDDIHLFSVSYYPQRHMATHILPGLRGSGIQVTWGLFSSGVMAAVGNTMTDRKSLLVSPAEKCGCL